MLRSPTRLILSVLAVASLSAGIWYSTRPEPVAVLLESVQKGNVEDTVANTRAGTVEACRRAKLSPGTGGQIAVLDITEGDFVRAGSLLLQLWNSDLMAEIALVETEGHATRATARAACLQAEVAQREANRLLRLRKSGAVSEDAVDKAVTEAKAQKADCESANARTQISAARLQVIQAELERTRLTAPFDGVVAEINGEVNEYVTPSPPGIATPPAVDLIDNSCFYVAAPIDEVDAPKVRLNQPARITLDAFDDHHFPGVVQRIASYVLDIEKQSRTVEVEVEFSNPKDIEKLLAGYSADVEIILDVRNQALRIPTESVLEGNRVYLFHPDSRTIEQRQIETGISNWDHTEVLSGLAAGDQVVVSVDREGLEDGALVEVETAAE